LPKGIFGTGHPKPAFLKRTGGHDLIQIYFCQVDDVLVAAGEIIGIIGSGLIHMMRIRKWNIRVLVNLIN